MATGSIRSARAKIVVALGVVATCVAGAEVAMRIFAPVSFMRPAKAVGAEWPMAHRVSDLPGLAYELIPGVGVQIDDYFVQMNSDGMRGPEAHPADTPGLARVAVLGDSIAFGWKVEIESCVTEVLAARLAVAAPDRTVDVLNFGVAGYSTTDEVAQFEHRVLAFDPDVVVIAYCMNDPVTTPQQPLPRYFYDVPVWQYSHVLRAIARTRHVDRIQRYGGGDYYRYLHAEDGPEWPTVLAAFDRLAELTRPRGIPVVVAIFPWPREERWEDYPYAALHDQVAAAAAARGFVALDLLDAFRAHAPREVVFSATDPHPTVLGHDVASAELARVVLPLLPPLDRD